MKTTFHSLLYLKRKFAIRTSIAGCILFLISACGGNPEPEAQIENQANAKDSHISVKGNEAKREITLSDVAIEPSAQVGRDKSQSSEQASHEVQLKAQDSTPYEDTHQEVEALDDIFGLQEDVVVEKVSFVSKQDEGYLNWQTPESISYKEAKLMIVAPNGERIERVFGPGEPIMLASSLPDGIYSWESVVTPELDPYVMEQMRSSRQSGNLDEENKLMARLRAEGYIPSEEQSNANRQSGSFIVQDGIARPSLADEPGTDGG